MKPRMNHRRWPPVVICVVFAVGGLAACGEDDETGGSTVPPASASTVAPSSGPSVAPTDPAPTPVPSTSAPATTPTSEPSTVVCDAGLEAMLAVVDESIAGARLAAGGPWSLDASGAAFDDRTQPGEEFAYRLGLDCPVRATQMTPDGGERLVVGAWTGDRRAWVVQATDGPPTPYSTSVRFELFIDQPGGEWVEEQKVWVGTLDTGETVIVGTNDTSTGLTAKSWLSEVPRFEDLVVTNEAQREAIDVLLAAGARNVSVAEPAGAGVELAAVQFATPDGLLLVATVGTPDWFDPAAELFDGEQTIEDIGGIDVYVTTGVPESYAVGSVGWSCGEFVWYIDAVYGTMDELTEWAGRLIDAAGC